MAAVGEDAPLVASESGADWEVLENAMTPQEVPYQTEGRKSPFCPV